MRYADRKALTGYDAHKYAIATCTWIVSVGTLIISVYILFPVPVWTLWISIPVFAAFAVADHDKITLPLPWLTDCTYRLVPDSVARWFGG